MFNIKYKCKINFNLKKTNSHSINVKPILNHIHFLKKIFTAENVFHKIYFKHTKPIVLIKSPHIYKISKHILTNYNNKFYIHFTIHSKYSSTFNKLINVFKYINTINLPMISIENVSIYYIDNIDKKTFFVYVKNRNFI